MLTLLFLSVLTLVAAVVAGIVVVNLALGALVWLVLLPFRLLFKLVFGHGGLVLGVLLAPLLAVVAAVVVVGALLVALLSLLAPLVPIVLLAGFGWALYRLFVARHSASADDRF